MVNRARKRKLEKNGIIAKFDPASGFRLKYDISVPGGLLRSEHPSSVSGVIEANSEADFLRGVIVQYLNSFGFTPHDRAVSGVLGDVFGPFPARIRGSIAYAIIEGLGLYVSTDEEEVCDDEKCGAVKQSAIHPDPESIEGYDPDGDDVPLIDITSHSPECHVHVEVQPDRPEQPLRPATYKLEDIIVVQNPRKWDSLNNQAVDTATGEVSEKDAETDGEVSTVDADESVVTEETDGGAADTNAVDADAGAGEDEAQPEHPA